MEIKNVYVCKDGRYRAYYIDDDGKKRVCSYPRLLMEQKLGRKLKPDEDVHHKDEDISNNSIDNLEIIMHGEHQKKHAQEKQQYFDIVAICDVCGKEFLWTKKRQHNYYSDLRRGHKRIISCSKSCSSRYGRLVQIGKV